MRATTLVGTAAVLLAGSVGCGTVEKRDTSTDGGSEHPADAADEAGNEAGGGAGGSGGSGGGNGGAGGGVADARADGAAAACNPAAPFGAPTPLTAFNSADVEEALFLSEDQLTAYVSAARPAGAGSYDIWVATRTAVTQAFGALRLLDGVNGAGVEREGITTRDGLKLFFFSGPTTVAYHISVATRSSTVAAFGAPSLVAGLNSQASDVTPWLSADETKIYFGSTRAGGLGSFDLYVADFGVNGASNPLAVAELNSTEEDSWPVLSRDGLTIYFTSLRTTAGAKGGYDVWMARRSTVNDGFGRPQNVSEVNTAGHEWPTWLSADGCTLYLGGEHGTGNSDVFEARRGN